MNAEKGAEETKERAKLVARNGDPYTRWLEKAEKVVRNISFFLSFPLNFVGFVKVKALTFRTYSKASLGRKVCRFCKL